MIAAAVVAVVAFGARTAGAEPCPGPTDTPCACEVPGLPEIRRVARRHAGLDEAPRWRRRARLAGLLPWVTLRGARALAWDDAVYAAAPAEVGNRVVLEARLSWRLDRLLYDPAEPRLAATERDAVRVRGALDAEVTALYFRWRRAGLRAAEDEDSAASRLDVEEAWALLDARTGGWLERRCGGG